jgi:hypothetical protein
MNELDVARAIAAGQLTSPQRYENVWLFAIRITGTGYAYRPKLNEFVFRPPDKYLNEEFLARCNGMAVIERHPEKSLLNAEEYADKSIGAIFLPYIAERGGIANPSGDEVWGISKVYNNEAAARMEAGELSTSPAVFFRDLAVNQKLTLENGAKLLVEGDPSLLDHTALCERGVWDKGEEPSGIRSDDESGERQMTEKSAEEGADVAEKLDKIADALSSLHKRMDTVEESEKKRVEADKARKDAEEDAQRQRGDPERLAADAAKAKADADDIRKRIDEVAAMVKPVPDDDHAKLADAWTRADEVFASLGKQTPRAIPGETAAQYTRRVTRVLQPWSQTWKDADCSSQAFADDAAFGIVSGQVHSEALKHASDPATAPAGGLRTITKTVNGHIHNTFVGDPNSWMAQFAGPVKQKAKGAWLYNINRDGQCVSVSP